jgi:hypothetical protein
VNNVVHLPIVCFSKVVCQRGWGPLGKTIVAWKQLGRRREGFFECVRGIDKDNSEQVFYLFRAHEAVGMQWAAAHHPPGAYYDEVAMATPAFGSADEDILMAGIHE